MKFIRMEQNGKGFLPVVECPQCKEGELYVMNGPDPNGDPGHWINCPLCGAIKTGLTEWDEEGR